MSPFAQRAVPREADLTAGGRRRALLGRALFALLLGGMPAAGSWAAEGAPASPDTIGVSIDCRRTGRTAVCPNLLRSAIEESPIMRPVPRAEADLAIDVDIVQVGATDRVVLMVRPSATAPADPSTGSTDWLAQFELNSRRPVDAHLEQVRAGLDRAIAPYVLEQRPEVVQVSYVVPASTAEVSTGSPWGFFGWTGTDLSWSGAHRSGGFWLGGAAEHVLPDRLSRVQLGGNATYQRRPALVVDGHRVSLDRDTYLVDLTAVHAFDLDESWSVMGFGRAAHEDDLGRYILTTRAHIGIGYDLLPSDDELGNVCQIGYVIGHQYDHYNVPNEIGQVRVHLASHGVLAAVAFVRGGYNLSLSARLMTELAHPERRLVLTVAPQATLRIGDHVDLAFHGNLSQQRMPGRDTNATASAAALERAAADEPLSLTGMISLNFNWHPSNGARYSRWTSRSSLGTTSSL